MASRRALVLSLAALLASGLFLLASHRAVGLGFPLDDAWIHQTYARNLAQYREWSFVPGQPSAGSTSPLWTLLLALGYALRVDSLAWTYGLGVALLASNGALSYGLTRRLFPEARWAGGAAGLATVLEWHFVWAGVSGMETLLFTCLVTATFLTLLGPRRSPLLTGVLIGLSFAVRPDGLTLLPFALFSVWLEDWQNSRGGPAEASTPVADARAALPGTGLVLLGLASVALPYSVLNAWLGGSMLPNTFYAKQAEYAAHLRLPLLSRFAGLLLQPFVGGQAVLVPGIVWAGVRWIRGRNWRSLLLPLWALSFVGLYTLRLPVTYQHGRYMMPVIAAIVPVGVGGLVGWASWAGGRKAGWVIGRAWGLSAGVTWMVFLGLGARAYVADVGFVETGLAAPARWVAEHTEPGAVIAAHDIGALGYFGSRGLVDLAGLISPDVVPVIRDEAGLAEFIDERRADYLLVFPSWYPALTRAPQASALQRFDGLYSPPSIGSPVLYRWTRAPDP